MRWVLLLMLAAFVECSAQDNITIAFRYGAHVRTELPALVRNDTVFLEARSFVAAMGGRLISDGQDLVFDLGTAADPVVLTIEEADLVRSNDEVYIRLDAVRLGSDVLVQFDTSNLTAHLVAQRPLAVDRTANAWRDHLRAVADLPLNTGVDLRVPPRHALIGGASMSYAIVGSQSPGISSLNGRLDVGVFALGGSASARFDIRSFEGQPANVEWRAAWSRTNPGSEIWTRVGVGRVRSNLINGREPIGVAITNRPVGQRPLFADDSMVVDAPSGSTIDLSVDGTLVASVVADGAGRAAFPVPLRNGQTLITLDVFTPGVGHERRYRTLLIDEEMVSPGSIRHEFIATYHDDVRSAEVHTELNYGLTTWLTANASIDIMRDSEGRIYHEPRASLLARFWDASSASVGLDPFGSLHAALDLRSARWLTAAVHHEESRVLDIGGSRSPWSASMRTRDIRTTSVNATVLLATLGLSFTARGMRIEDQLGVAYTSLFSASYARGPITATTRLRWDVRPFADMRIADVSASLRMPESLPLPWLFGGVVLRFAATGSLDALQDVLPLWEVRKTAQFGAARLQASIIGGPHRPLTVNSTVSLIFDATEIRTTMRSASGNTALQTEVRGGLFVDPSMAMLTFDRFQRQAASGIAIRCFIDDNANNTYDTGEEIMHDIGVLCPAGRQRPLPSGFVVISDLQPDTEYMIAIDSASVGSDLLTLSARRVSVVTESNVITSIDVPVHRTAVIAGTVPAGVGAVEIVQPNGETRSTRVYADGSFAVHGIRPGLYEVRAAGCSGLSVEVTEPQQYDVAPCRSAQ